MSEDTSAAGPFAVLIPEDYLPALELPHWSDALLGIDDEVGRLAADLSADEEALIAEAAATPADELAADAADAEDGIINDLLVVDDLELAGAGEAAPEVDDLILEAHREIPPEAWQPTPDPYQPPVDAGGWQNTDDQLLAPITYPAPPGQEPPPGPYTGPAAVYILNMQRWDSRDFRVTETWRIVVEGTPDQPVTVEAWQNDEARGVQTMGFTDSMGVWWGEGTMAGEHVGRWVEIWRVGENIATPHLTFEVTW